MEANHTRFLRGRIPSRIEKLESGVLRVFWKSPSDENLPEESEEFDTVLLAIGRDPNTKGLGLDRIPMKLEASSGKIIADELDQTSVPGVYAIGDVVGRPTGVDSRCDPLWEIPCPPDIQRQ